MQPPARSAEAWRVFSLVQAPMLARAVYESMGEKQQKEKISSLDEWYSENNGG
jgi:hypothetical protein